MKDPRTTTRWVAVGAIVVLALLSAQALRLREKAPDSPPRARPAVSNMPRPASTHMRAPTNPQIVAEPDDTERTLALFGTIQAESQVTLSVRMPARIASVAVRQGDRVTPGQIILRLDDTDLQSELRSAQAAVRAAQAQVRQAIAGREARRVEGEATMQQAQSSLQQAQIKLRQAEIAQQAARDDLDAERHLAHEGLRKAEAALEQARRTLLSLEALATVGGVARNDLEAARMQVQVAESDLETARTQAHRLEAGPEPGSPGYRVALSRQDVETARAAVAQAREALRTAQKAHQRALAVSDAGIRAARAALAQARTGEANVQAAIAATRLVSPIQGVVSQLQARAGETAQPGVPLATIVSLNDLRVEMLVAARQLPRIRIGQTGQVSVDTRPGQTFPVRVTEIAQAAEADGRSFRVRLQFLRPSPLLRPGQTARITLRP
ncbi:MAG: efflux RND transporter periplasmic adaptor subunit [Chloroherpetonaceae bacterium]|nr:efflux RND transporter periplasmic adaptor subunit [Chloroherpetonaceae bacterium]